MSDIPIKAFSEHIGIVGKTGSGKTYTAKTEVERLLEEQRRVCIIDPTGVWWGLRSSSDGKGEGFAVVIFGGDHADVEIDEHSGQDLADFVVNDQTPCVIDLSEFSNAARNRFMNAFLGRLYTKNRSVLYLVLDEADAFAPQSPMPDSRMTLHHVSQIVRRGRVKGLRVMMLTQRPATIHKDVLTQIGTMICMRLMSPQDRKAIEDWVKGNADVNEAKEVISSLPKLAVGEGWIYAPSQEVLKRVKFPMIKTFDSGRTPDDDDDISDLVPKKRTEIDIKSIRKAFKPKPDPEKEPVQDKGALDKILATEKGISYREGHDHGFEKGRQQGHREGMETAIKLISDNAELKPEEPPVARLEISGTVDRDIVKLVERDIVKLNDGAKRQIRELSTPRFPPKPSTTNVTTKKTLSPSELKWLEVFGRWPGIYLSWQVAGILIKRKTRGGHFNTVKRNLIENGWVVESDGKVHPTGKAEAYLPDQTKSKVSVLQSMLNTLPSPANAMLKEIMTSPRKHDVQSLADALGKVPRGGHWNSGMKILRDCGVMSDAPFEVKQP